MIPEISSIISNVASIFITVTIPTFTFASTLLNKTLSRLEKEKKDAIEKSNISINQEISNLLNELKRKNIKEKRSAKLQERLDGLKKQESEGDRKIKQVERRYGALGLADSVILPTTCLLLSIVFCKLSGSYNFVLLSTIRGDLRVDVFLVLLSLLLVIYAVYKIYRTLALIQEISLPTDDFQVSQMATALKKALHEHSDNQKEVAKLDFSKSVVFQAGELATLKFAVSISSGKIIKDAKIFFYFREGFRLTEGVQSVVQRAEFAVPNALTLIKEVGDVSVGVRRPSEIEFFVPNEEGKYIISYQVFGQGYKKDIENLYIEVTNGGSLKG